MSYEICIKRNKMKRVHLDINIYWILPTSLWNSITVFTLMWANLIFISLSLWLKISLTKWSRFHKIFYLIFNTMSLCNIIIHWLKIELVPRFCIDLISSMWTGFSFGFHMHHTPPKLQFEVSMFLLESTHLKRFELFYESLILLNTNSKLFWIYN